MADVPVNDQRAAMVMAFFDRLCLPDVAGTPALKDACGDWFRDILVAFLASEDPESGARLVWEALCLVPKKNSKTTYTAGLGLTALFLEDVPNSQMMIVAPSQNISERCFQQAQGMIRLDPLLNKAFKIQDHKRTITLKRNGSTLTVKTFDTQIVTGEIPRLTIIDELHELGKKHHAQAVMQQVRGGSITAAGGQVFFITTQSDKAPAGIWKTELQKARKIRDGKAGESPIMLPILYEFPEELQKQEGFWRDRANWPLVLPNIGRSIDAQKLEDDYENNGKATPEAEQIWVSQHLNIEIGLGLHDQRWIGADYWPGAACPDLDLEFILDSSEVAVLGVDAGGLDDLLGLAVLGRHKDTRVWQHWGRAWADRAVLDIRKSVATELEALEEAGELAFVDDLEAEANPEIVQVAKEIRDRGLFPAQAGIGMDPQGVGTLVDALAADGFLVDEMIRAVSQGFRLNSAIKNVPIKLKNKTFVHCGQRLMSWSVSNAQTEQTKNAVIVHKAVSGSAKIDPLMALFNAAILMGQNPMPSTNVISIPENYEVA